MNRETLKDLYNREFAKFTGNKPTEMQFEAVFRRYQTAVEFTESENEVQVESDGAGGVRVIFSPNELFPKTYPN